MGQETEKPSIAEWSRRRRLLSTPRRVKVRSELTKTGNAIVEAVIFGAINIQPEQEKRIDQIDPWCLRPLNMALETARPLPQGGTT